MFHKEADDALLGAAVDKDHREPRLAVVHADAVGHDLGHEIAGVEVRKQPGFPDEAFRVGPVLGRREQPPHDALVSKLLGQGAGVDPGNPGDAVFLEPFMKIRAGGHMRGVLAMLGHDIADDVRPGGFETFGIYAVVPDERIGLTEDLSMKGGIGDGFGIADHPRAENDFPPGLGRRTESVALKDAAVFEGKPCLPYTHLSVSFCRIL